MFELKINGETRQVEVEADTPLLWVLRDTLGLTGTKFGCGIAACGACMVHVDGQVAFSCITPASALVGKQITTIEGLGAKAPHPVQQAWLDNQVAQCGYCQSGMIMASAALLKQNPNPTDDEIKAAISNICRCGTYPRVVKAIHAAAGKARGLS